MAAGNHRLPGNAWTIVRDNSIAKQPKVAGLELGRKLSGSHVGWSPPSGVLEVRENVRERQLVPPCSPYGILRLSVWRLRFGHVSRALDLVVCFADECEVLHTCSNCPALPSTKGAVQGNLQLSEYPRGNAPSFSADQIDAMNRAFRQACARMGLTGSTPVIELVAVRILEIAYGGEFDPDTMAEKVVAEFGA
jgi:hypothetical protein